MKNLKLLNESVRTSFGGELLKNSHAKCKRPWSPKAAMHVVLKAKQHKLTTIDRKAEKIIEQKAKKHFIQIYRIVNVGNHIHLVIKVRSKITLSNFLRATCGALAKIFKLDWVQRPFSRIVKWGQDFKHLKEYMTVNHYESQGYKRYQARFMAEMDRGLYLSD